MPRATVDKITHLNAMREYHFDPFASLRRENCTVGALRAEATHVSVEPRQNLGGLRPEKTDAVEAARRPVTSGDIMKMFASA